ncbi:MAG: hypothetical protein PSN35_04620 [Candidatus Thioglobus sp.]|uniref:hypothetical protein n=1 Tax=Candidatus Thioglobus sp. TaxID=2026721 RepID=UPI00261CFFB2|nr:hypothetical protein [Candidatus Thioglobus sp.]MDC9727100.1 hypothetical protein [Candidatus Thioglobus sp.]
MGGFQKILLMVLITLSASASAEKEIFYSDKNITIYTDNTVVQTGKSTAPVFKPSSTWVEEDFFTQQEKYCEVDAIHKDRMNLLLKKFSKTAKPIPAGK